MSALGQKRTHAVQQKNRYSMSVLARVPYREHCNAATSSRGKRETGALAIKARALRLRHDNSAVNESRI